MREHSDAWMEQIARRGAEIAASWESSQEPSDQVLGLAPETLARMIDHTLLKPEASPEMVDALCDEAREYGFASVCVNSSYVARCAERLKGTDIAVGTVAGFPLGAMLTEAKAFEAARSIELGAQEIDMVLAIGALKGGDVRRVYDDIAVVVEACHSRDALCKVIIETVFLTDAEKATACLLIAEAGADFCKTSTGFAGGGATADDVALMRQVVGPAMGIKAAGGVRTYADAMTMISAGATRIGASSGIQIVQGAL